MGHLIHFEEAPRRGDVLVVTMTGDQHITKKRSVSFHENYRARQVASLEIVDYVAIVDEPSAGAAIEALHPDVYVKGPEYSNLLLDKTSNILHEKALIESYGGRIHFTSGETFSSTKLSHFLLSSTEASQDNPAAAQRARPLPRRLGAPASRSRRSRRSCRARRAARLPARRDDHRRVGRRHGQEHLAEVAMRRRPRDGPGAPDRRRPASSRCTCPAS